MRKVASLETPPSIPPSRFAELNRLPLSIQIGSYGCEFLGWGFIEPVWWRNYLHMHSYFEICYVFQGCGTFRVEQQIYPVKAGEIFLARPGMVHEIISSQEQPLGIYFWSHTLIPQSGTDLEQQDVDRLISVFLADKSVLGCSKAALPRTLEALTAEVVLREPGYQQAIQGLLYKLLLDTIRVLTERQEQSEPVPTRNPEEAVVQLLIRYMRDNYRREILLRDLAAQVHLSERHTNRLFHKVMGVSIMAYLANLRIEIAAQLLLDKELSIKEVAQETGYPDVRYFSTLFRQSRGQTPAVFRRSGGTTHLMGL